MPALDRKDFALIKALQENASRRLEELARVVNLAPSSVHDRLRRLERMRVIKGWGIDVDAAAVGLGVLAYIGISSKKPCADFVESLRAIPAIEECHSVAGELSMLLKVRVADTAALLNLTDRLKKIPGVEQTHTTIVLKSQFERPLSPGDGPGTMNAVRRK